MLATSSRSAKRNPGTTIPPGSGSGVPANKAKAAGSPKVILNEAAPREQYASITARRNSWSQRARSSLAQKKRAAGSGVPISRGKTAGSRSTASPARNNPDLGAGNHQSGSDTPLG